MDKKSSKPIPLIHTAWIAVTGLLSIALLYASYLHRTDTDNQLIIISLFLSIYAGFLLQREYKRREMMSPLALYSFLIILHFAAPGILAAMWGMGFVNTDNLAAAPKAQIFILICFIFFHCGHTIVRSDIGSKLKVGFGSPDSWNSTCVKLVVLVFSIVGWLDRFFIVSKNAYFQIDRTTIGELSEKFHTVLRLGEQLPGIALIIIWIYFWHRPNRKFSAWWWSGCILWLSELAYWTPTGRKEEVILALLIPMMIRYLFTRKLPSIRAGALSIIFIIVLFPTVHYYRIAMQLGAGGDFTETIHTSAVAINETKQSTGQEWWHILGSRINLLEATSASVRIADSDIWPLFLGRTYAWVRYSIVPRAIWKEKPDFHYGTAFGHASGMLNPMDNKTSVSVTFFGEAYLNFLWLGVIVMFFIGLIFGLIYQRIFKGRSQATWVFLYLMTLPVILYIGGTFALYFSGLIHKLIIFGIVAHFLSGRLGHPATKVTGSLS